MTGSFNCKVMLLLHQNRTYLEQRFVWRRLIIPSYGVQLSYTSQPRESSQHLAYRYRTLRVRFIDVTAQSTPLSIFRQIKNVVLL